MSSLKEGKGFSMSMKTKQSTENLTPGPGQYNPINCSRPSSPQVSIKGKYSQHPPDKTPGPGSYLAKTSTFNKEHGYSLGRSDRGSVNLNATSPGPGAYNPNPVKLLKDSPKYSLSKSRF